ncbi:sulfur carrier protein ThiS [Halothiobacillus sp. DCM-1]
MISVNGELSPRFGEGSISALLEHKGLLSRRLAVELNGEIVPRAEWPSVMLSPGDRVEIVQAIGGG